MNGQYYGDRVTPSNFVEKNVNEMNSPAVNSDPYADNVLADAEMVQAMPLGGTLADAGPVSEPQASVIPIYDAPVKEAPAEEIIPVVGRLPNYSAAASESVVNDWGSKPMPSQAPMVAPIVYEAPIAASTALSTALLNTEDSEHFRTRWNEIQGKFVDEPRAAVQQADALVADVVEQITHMFASEHTSLESQWNQGSEVSTEDLRKALQKYRSFFNRLVV